MRRLIFNKKLQLILVFAGLLALTIFLLNNTWVTISSQSSEPKLVLIRDTEDNIVKELEISNGSKRVFLKRSNYTFQVSSENKLSLYKKSLGFPWRNNLKIELYDQKSSVYLGKSEFPCAKDQKKESLFFSCRRDDNTNTIVSSQRGEQYYKPITPVKADHELLGAGILQSYRNGFLDARVNASGLVVSTRETGGREFTKLDGFRGVINQDTFSLSLDSENFAAYNDKTDEVISFKSVSDKQPSVISLPGSETNSEMSTKIIATKDYLYVIKYLAAHHESEDEALEEQAIYSYKASDNSLASKFVMPGDWQLQRTTGGPDSQALLAVVSDAGSRVMLIKGSAAPLHLDQLPKAPQDVCWKDKDSFYYLTDASKNIFSHSLSKKASFLAYGGLDNNTYIGSINCFEDSLYIVYDQTQARHRVKDKYFGYHHYKLGGESFAGVRPEAVLPVFVAVGKDVLEANNEPGGVKIEVKYDGDNNPATPSKAQALKAVKDELENKGVNPEGLSLLFDF